MAKNQYCISGGQKRRIGVLAPTSPCRPKWHRPRSPRHASRSHVLIGAKHSHRRRCKIRSEKRKVGKDVVRAKQAAKPERAAKEDESRAKAEERGRGPGSLHRDRRLRRARAVRHHPRHIPRAISSGLWAAARTQNLRKPSERGEPNKNSSPQGESKETNVSLHLAKSSFPALRGASGVGKGKRAKH